jgi:hypothetical protein
MGWTVRGSNPGRGEIFRTCPDRPWGPSSFLYNGCRVHPEGKAAGAWRWPSTPCSAEVKERAGLYVPLLALWAFVACSRVNFFIINVFRPSLSLLKNVVHTVTCTLPWYVFSWPKCVFCFRCGWRWVIYQPYHTHTASLPAEQNWAVGPCQPVKILYA